MLIFVKKKPDPDYTLNIKTLKQLILLSEILLPLKNIFYFKWNLKVRTLK